MVGGAGRPQLDRCLERRRRGLVFTLRIVDCADIGVGTGVRGDADRAIEGGASCRLVAKIEIRRAQSLITAR